MTEYEREAQFLERIQRGEKVSDPGEMPREFKDALSELLTICPGFLRAVFLCASVLHLQQFNNPCYG